MKKDKIIVGILSKIKNAEIKNRLNREKTLKAGLYVLTVCALCSVLTGIISELRGIKKAYCLYINDNAIVVSDSKKDIKNSLKEVADSYKTEKNTVSFADKIVIKKVNADKKIIKNEKETEDFFEEIIKTNPDILKVKAVSYEKQTEKIYYDTKIRNDASEYQGKSKVIAEGINGEKEVLYEVVTLNGEFFEKSGIEENIIKEPVDKIVVAGTKPKPKNAPTGTFQKPYGGNISSRFGSRWGRKHQGIDYTGSIGDSIYASDGGEVIFAGWDNGGYGNMVKIMHNDGYETFYAHLNSVNVKEGQKVSQGDVIGKLGNTGRSTGAHLHFEIRKDGVAFDPLDYTK